MGRAVVQISAFKTHDRVVTMIQAVLAHNEVRFRRKIMQLVVLMPPLINRCR